MNHWPTVRIGDVLHKSEDWISLDPNTRYKEVTVRLWGNGVVLRREASGADIAAPSRLRVHQSQFIISRIDARNGASGLIPEALEGAIVSSDFPVFSPNAQRLLPSFLHWMSKTHVFVDICKAASEGTTNRVRLKEERFLDMKIPLPPLNEQRRIVDRIDALAVKIDEARALQSTLQRERAALSTAVISRFLADLEYHGVLGDILLAPPRNGWSAKCDGLDTGTPILSLSAVTGFRYRPDQFKWTGEATDADAQYWLKAGDLLMSRSNTPDLVGHTAIYNGMPSPCIYPDLLMVLRPDPDRCDLRFAYYALQSQTARDFIKINAKGTSPTMKKISQSTVMAIPFPTACPMKQQLDIVTRLDAIHANLQVLGNNQAAAAKELRATLPSILNRAFRGAM